MPSGRSPPSALGMVTRRAARGRERRAFKDASIASGKPSPPPRGRCDIFYAHTVHARRSAVNPDLVPGGRQNVAPVSPVAQRVKPILPAPASP